MLSNSELRILRAAGASTTQLNTLDISSGTSSEDSYEFANALLVEGDRLAVVTTASSMDSDLSGSDVCHLRLYDISEPSTPTLLRTFSQDGLYEGIGTANGLLFLVSAGTADLDEASGSAASMPQIGDNAESEAVPASQFYLSSALDAPTFAGRCAAQRRARLYGDDRPCLRFGAGGVSCAQHPHGVARRRL